MAVNSSSNNTRLILFIVAVCVVVTGIALFGKMQQSKTKPVLAQTKSLVIDGTLLPKPKVLTPFQLTATTGQAFSPKSLVGHWTMVFFGFTNCALVCPTTMTEMNKMYVSLQKKLPKAKLPKVVMVSVDPQRDSLNRINGYVHAFNKHFMGARGDIEHVKQLAQQMNVVFTKLSAKDGQPGHYTISHSAEVMVLNPNGDLVAFLSYPHKAKQMVHDYQVIIKQSVSA